MKLEPTFAAQGWRALIGPAHLIDGVVRTITFGYVGFGISLMVATRLAKSRIK